MKKTLWIIIAFLGLILVWGITTYNKFVNAEEKMTQAWSQVENVYQRRLELIPNLTEVVKAYSNYENTTLVEVVEKRASSVVTTTAGPESMTQEQLLQFEESQQLLGDAVNDVIVSLENYPELKAMETYQTFIAQYEGSENRILVERKRYNEMVKNYNQSILSFPNSLIAKTFGFEQHAYFR